MSVKVKTGRKGYEFDTQDVRKCYNLCNPPIKTNI